LTGKLAAARDDLVRLRASGACGSDLHVAQGEWPVEHLRRVAGPRTVVEHGDGS